jgi:hypothetical protein
MDKQKQIEEMCEILNTDCGDCENCAFLGVKWEKGVDCIYLFMAEALYNAGYRKIPEGAVVLTQEEWAVHNEQFAQAMYQKEVNTRKETAEKFAEMLKLSLDKNDLYVYSNDDINEICKELTEGEV